MTRASFVGGLEYVLSSEFQDNVAASTARWDKEWMRYLSIHDDCKHYFYDMSTENYALIKAPKKIEAFGKPEMYFTKLFKNISCHIWIEGCHVVGKTILEMGCGPGVLGRLTGRFAKEYIGIDASQFALSIARLTSPKSCKYIHLSEVRAIEAICKSADVCVGRNFFIHHNYEDSLWILRFLRDLTRPGGRISADFFCNAETMDHERRRLASAPLHDKYASALYHFSHQDIKRLSRDAGVECLGIDDLPEQQRRFATLLVAA